MAFVVVSVSVGAPAEHAFFADDAFAGCRVTTNRHAVRADCLGTLIEVEIASEKRTATVTAAAIDKADRDAGWVDLDAEYFPFSTTPAPKQRVVLKNVALGTSRFIATYGDRVIRCTRDSGVSDRCSMLASKLLGPTMPEAGLHPLVVAGVSLSTSTCTFDGASLRCGDARLFVQAVDDPEDVFDGFGRAARQASTVPCRFLGGERTCSAVRWRTAAKKSTAPLDAELVVWTSHAGQRIVCHSDGPAPAPLCVALFGPVGLTPDRVAMPLPTPPSPEAKAPPARALDGCRVVDVKGVLTATCADMTATTTTMRAGSGDWQALIDQEHAASTAKKTPQALIVRRIDDAERVSVATVTPTNGRHFAWVVLPSWRGVSCQTTKPSKSTTSLADRCLALALAFEATDARPGQWRFKDITFAVPDGCTMPLTTAVLCDGIGGMQLVDGAKAFSAESATHTILGSMFPKDAVVADVDGTVGGAKRRCVRAKYEAALVPGGEVHGVHVVLVNGDGWGATCTSLVRDHVLPTVCQSFVSLP